MAENSSLSDARIAFSKKIRKRLILIHNICNLLCNTLRLWERKKVLLSNIAKFFLPPLSEPIICPTIFDFDLCLSKDGGHWVYCLGFYEIGTLDVMRKCLRPGDVFVDVGSSMGLMSLTASFAVGNNGRVLSFEPDTERFFNLVNSISINQRKNIKAFNMGLGAERKTIPLFKDRCSPSMVALDNNAPHEMVDIDTLETILKKENISIVDFIKIDVEGFEMDVLQGAEKILTQKTAPIICVEYIKSIKRNSGSSETIFDFIKNINAYHFYQLSKTSRTISKFKSVPDKKSLHKHDNLYCFLSRHLERLPKEFFKE